MLSKLRDIVINMLANVIASRKIRGIEDELMRDPKIRESRRRLQAATDTWERHMKEYCEKFPEECSKMIKKAGLAD